MSLLTVIANGTAARLAAHGIATWNPAGAYPTGPALPPIYVGVSAATPDRTITLTPYGVDDTASETGTYGLQVRLRGTRDPRTAYRLDDDVFGVLHRVEGFELVDDTDTPTQRIVIASCLRRSGPTPIGQDSGARGEVTSNYYLEVGRTSGSAWS